MKNETKTAFQHALISLLCFLIFVILIQVVFPLLKEQIANLVLFIGPGTTLLETSYLVIYILLISLCATVSYALYLILTANTRAKLVAFGRTKILFDLLEQFRSIYEGAPVPFITLNNRGDIVDQNKAALRFFGVGPEGISGKNIFEFLTPEYREQSEKFSSYYDSKIPIDREEVQMVTPEGKVRSVMLSVFRAENPVKKGRAGLATIFDITKEKELDRAKTQFVSLASHQLRSPIVTVKWYVEMLLSGDLGPLNEKQLDYISRLGKVNQSMTELVETLLSISRIEIGALAIDKKRVNVPKIIDDILPELETVRKQNNVKIIRQYDGNLTDIEGDPRLLRIVIQNLISNALKYARQDGTVEIRLKESWSERSIIITDDGIGIPENEQDKIFTKLFRASNARTLEGNDGTGLGLYLVKSIMEALGGSISFFSKENRGSTFVLKI